MPDVTEKNRKSLTKDNNGVSVPITPSMVPWAVTVSGTISAAQSVTLNAQTSLVRIYAIDKDVCLTWGTTTPTATSFHEIIPANQICDFYVPKGYTALKVIERAATATVVILEK